MNNSQKSQAFNYVQLHDYLISVNQSPITLCWLLLFRKTDLTSIYTPWLKESLPKRFPGYIRYYLRRVIFICKTLIEFMQYKLGIKSGTSVIELPVNGQLCKYVHKGYKVFDLKAGRVSKIFDPDVNKDTISDELEQLKMVSPFEFAPSVERWNIEERWYEEEYISGTLPPYYKSLDSADLIKSFKSEIMTCLISVMQFKLPRLMRCSDYVKELIALIENKKSERGEALGSNNDKITEIMHSVVDRLKNMGDREINLVFSHGDFCPANMLNTKNGIKLVDWEGAGYRSVLFDFYSFFFYRPAFIGLPMNKMIREVDEALNLLISSDDVRNTFFNENSQDLTDIYRQVFYLELICRLAIREETDSNLDIMDFLTRYVHAFMHFEEMRAESIMLRV